MPCDASIKQPIRTPSFWTGAAFCGLFALLAVAVRGIRWDETYEHAQILAGQVAYPPGHPLALYVHNAFSLQTYFSGLLLHWGLGPVVLCGFRNVLFLLASMLPVYLLGAWLTRSAIAGLAATLLVLQGILLEFDGSYPTMVWPELYSNGHIGGGLVLLGLCAVVMGARRTAFFLGGLLPCIHVGQWPPLAGALTVYALHLFLTEGAGGIPHRSGKRASLVASLGFGVLGLVCTVAFWLIHRHFVLPLPASGPFAVAGDADAVWRGYTAFHDPHRQFPPGNGHVVLVGTVLLCWLAATFGRSPVLRRGAFWLAVYASFIAAAVWGTMLLHAWFGARIPFLLIAWMPYRLINHLPPLVLAVIAGAILTRWPGRGVWVLCGAVSIGVLQPLWPLVLGAALHQRYVSGGECVAFLLYGVALFAVAPARPPGRYAVIAAALLSITPLAMYHRFGAACVVLGVVLAYGVDRTGTRESRRAQPAVAFSILVLGAGFAALLWHQQQYRQNLPVSPFEAEARAALAGRASAMLLGPPDSILLQATTNVPVLVESATPSLISYVPAIGPGIDQLYEDIYGFGFRGPGPDTGEKAPWEQRWQERPRAVWQSLGLRYGFTHVVAPVHWKLELPQIVAGNDYGLYAVSE